VHIFLSHNSKDKEFVRKLATQLRLVGGDVWLDEWEIKPGDRIPSEVSAALAAVDTIVVVWSVNAANSRWVDAELSSALARELSSGSMRVIPVRLDDTALPALLQPIAWIDAEDEDAVGVARKIMGLSSSDQYIKAVQAEIEEAGLEFEYFHGYGVSVGCPRCGAPVSELEPWSATDYTRDDEYAGVRCKRCKWEDGGEI
jgi:DNA-directed RNA polymerase subunit RPC12/RpoP